MEEKEEEEEEVEEEEVERRRGWGTTTKTTEATGWAGRLQRVTYPMSRGWTSPRIFHCVRSDERVLTCDRVGVCIVPGCVRPSVHRAASSCTRTSVINHVTILVSSSCRLSKESLVSIRGRGKFFHNDFTELWTQGEWNDSRESWIRVGGNGRSDPNIYQLFKL